MSKDAHGEIDAELEQLGRVPVDLGALIARYAGSDLRLPQVDKLLASLGSPGSASTSPHQAAVRSAEATAVGMEVPVGAMAAFPWESERPLESSEPEPAEDPSATLPPETRSEVGLSTSAELTDDDEPVMTLEPAGETSGDEARLESQRTHDTLEDRPAAAKQPSAEPALELAAGPGAAGLPLTAATGETPATSAQEASAVAEDPFAQAEEGAASADGDAPAGADDADEFEILVDDELLEIAEDEVVLDSDGEETT